MSVLGAVVICLCAAVICFAFGMYVGIYFTLKMEDRCGECLNCRSAHKHMPCERR